MIQTESAKFLLEQLRILSSYCESTAIPELQFVRDHSRAIWQTCEHLMELEQYLAGAPDSESIDAAR